MHQQVQRTNRAPMAKKRLETRELSNSMTDQIIEYGLPLVSTTTTMKCQLPNSLRTADATLSQCCQIY